MGFTRDLDFFTITPLDIDFPKVIANINNLPDNDTPTGKILSGDGYSIALTEFIDMADSCE